MFFEKVDLALDRTQVQDMLQAPLLLGRLSPDTMRIAPVSISLTSVGMSMLPRHRPATQASLALAFVLPIYILNAVSLGRNHHDQSF